MITILAPAKINLTLTILGKAPDGYHQLESVMQKLDICDSLDIELTTDDELHFTCSDASLSGEDNLVLRAARLLRPCTHRPVGARIHLTKVIPAQAGLGGGSSDAGALLLALNKGWQLALSLQELTEIARQLGADVAFFLGGSSAIVSGRGERVAPFEHSSTGHLVLVKNNIGLATREVYQKLHATPTELWPLPDLSCETVAMRNALQANDYQRLLTALHNDLETPAFQLLPELLEARNLLYDAGCDAVILCGSGSALCGFCHDDATAHKAAMQLRECFSWVRTATFLPPAATE